MRFYIGFVRVYSGFLFGVYIRFYWVLNRVLFGLYMGFYIGFYTGFLFGFI